MKRALTFLMACCLAVTANVSAFTTSVHASEAPKAAEASTEAHMIDLLSEELEDSPILETKGAHYKLDTLSESPDITAESAIVLDARSGEVLYSKQADETRYPASITKVMTTLLAIENCKMSDTVEFTKEAVNSIEPGSSSAGINAGAKLTVEETLYALMLVSANEAGAAIAEHVSGSQEEFAKLMTSRAKELGCTGTQFKNPHGLPNEEHYTTARDMGLIMKECVKHEEFRKFASTIHYTIEKNDTLSESIDLWNHAKILRDSSEYYYENAKGAKTGYTMAALNTLVTYAEKDNTRLICVILKDHGADRSYIDSRNLYKWAFSRVKTVFPLSKYDLNAALDKKVSDTLSQDDIDAYKSLNPTFARKYPVILPKDVDSKKFKRTLRLNKDITKGTMGTIEVHDGDNLIFSTPVTFDVETEVAKNYISGHAASDDLQTADVSNKNNLLRKAGVFFLRIIIAILLIYVIMQLIHRWQLEQNRKKRIQARERRRNAKNGSSRSAGSSGTAGRSGTASSGKGNASSRGSKSGKGSNTANRTKKRSGTQATSSKGNKRR